MLKQPKNKGEYYLTDAFQYMIDKGAKIKVDRRRGLVRRRASSTRCSRRTATMLEKGRARAPAAIGDGATIVEPVYIEDGVTIANSTVGPNVSIGAGTIIEHSTMRDTIVGHKLPDRALHAQEFADRRRGASWPVSKAR